MPRITRRFIADLEPGPADRCLWDDLLPGFGVRQSPSGRAVYVVRYRTRTGTARKMTLARVSDLPPDEARERARRIFAAVADGKDPAGERRERKDAPTVADLARDYQERHARPHKKPRTVENEARYWSLHILPRLGTRKVADVSRADIMALHSALFDRPTTANRCVELLSHALNVAEDWEWRPRQSNPCHRLKKYRENTPERILTPDELSRLSAALPAFAAQGREERSFGYLVRLLLLTGCRLREIMDARREWFDLDSAMLNLPDSKTGKKTVYLSPAAVAVAREASGYDPRNPYLLAGRLDDEPLKNVRYLWARLLRSAEIEGRVRLHDLRHTVGSYAHRSGLTLRQVAGVLGHRNLKTTERYVHDPEKAKASEAAAAVIDRMMRGINL